MAGQSFITDPSDTYALGLFVDNNGLGFGSNVCWGTVNDSLISGVGLSGPVYDVLGAFNGLTDRSAYGVSVIDSNSVITTGYADTPTTGVTNLVPQIDTGVPAGGHSATILAYLFSGAQSNHLVSINHAFSFPAGHPSIIVDSVTITNLTAGPLVVKFRSLTAFTIATGVGTSNSSVVVPSPSLPQLSSVTGFPLGTAAASSASADPTIAFPQPQPGTFNPSDMVGGNSNPPSGAGFTLDFGVVAAGASVSFSLVYAIGQPGETLNQLAVEVTASGGSYQISGTNVLLDNSGNVSGVDNVIVAVGSISGGSRGLPDIIEPAWIMRKKRALWRKQAQERDAWWRHA